MKKSVFVASLALIITSAQAEMVMPNKDSGAHNQLFINALSNAYQNNPDVHTGLREYYAAVEAIPLARAGWLPTLTLTGQGQHTKSLSNGKTTAVQPTARVRSNTASDTISLDTTLRQNLFNGGQTTYAIESAKAAVRAAQMKFVGVEQKVLLDAVRAYLDLWKAYETLRYRVASVGFRERVVAQVKAQEDVGEKTRTDVAEARSRLAGAVADKVTAEATVASAQATYEQIIGGNYLPQHLDLPGFIVPKSSLPATLKDLNDLAFDQSPTLQQAIFAEKSEKAKIGIAESELLPNVDLTASAKRQKSNTQTRLAAHGGPTSDRTGFDYTNSGTLGVVVTVPLFQAGAKWSGIRKANQQRYQALSAVKKARLEVIQAAAATWENVRSLEVAVRQIELQVEAAQLNLEGKRQEYIVGEVTLTDTLIAEQNLVDAQVQLVNRQRDYHVTFYQLMSLYAALLPGPLGLPVDRHDIMGYTGSMSGKIFGTGNLRIPTSVAG